MIEDIDYGELDSADSEVASEQEELEALEASELDWSLKKLAELKWAEQQLAEGKVPRDSQWTIWKRRLGLGQKPVSSPLYRIILHERKRQRKQQARRETLIAIVGYSVPLLLILVLVSLFAFNWKLLSIDTPDKVVRLDRKEGKVIIVGHWSKEFHTWPTARMNATFIVCMKRESACYEAIGIIWTKGEIELREVKPDGSGNALLDAHFQQYRILSWDEPFITASGQGLEGRTVLKIDLSTKTVQRTEGIAEWVLK